MKYILISILLLSSSVFAQHTFDLKNASKFFDIKVNVEKCEDGSCTGKATFSFYKKGSTKAYQVITLPDTYIDTSEGGVPAVNETMLYDKQSVIVVDDFNFDGMEDVAICDGTNGGYGMPSFQIYLSSRAAGKFVHSPAFSELGQHLGMFDVDKENKTIQYMDKSGCCWHETTRYKIIGGRPVKVWVLTEDATGFDEKANKRIVKTTEKTLVRGRWRSKMTVERVKDDN
jgi:hypothetical protein